MEYVKDEHLWKAWDYECCRGVNSIKRLRWCLGCASCICNYWVHCCSCRVGNCDYQLVLPSVHVQVFMCDFTFSKYCYYCFISGKFWFYIQQLVLFIVLIVYWLIHFFLGSCYWHDSNWDVIVVFIIAIAGIIQFYKFNFSFIFIIILLVLVAVILLIQPKKHPLFIYIYLIAALAYFIMIWVSFLIGEGIGPGPTRKYSSTRFDCYLTNGHIYH